MRLLRVVDRWFALTLTAGAGTQVAARPFVGTHYRVWIGAGVALLAAVGLTYRWPDLDSGPLWRIGLVTVGVVLALDVLAGFALTGAPDSDAAGFVAGLAVGLLAERLHRRRSADRGSAVDS